MCVVKIAMSPIKPSWSPRVCLSAVCLLPVGEGCDRKGEIEWQD